MDKFYLKNWRTFPFKEKSFDGQLDRYATACVTSVRNPNKILDIVPVWGRNYNGGMGKLIDLIHKKEQGFELDKESLQFLAKYNNPIDGEFVETKSLNGPLFRVFTRGEAECGLCRKCDVNKPERDINGNVVIYNTIKVFTMSRYDSELRQYNYVRGWFPANMYSNYIYYRYFPMEKLENFLNSNIEAL